MLNSDFKKEVHRKKFNGKKSKKKIANRSKKTQHGNVSGAFMVEIV